MKVSPDGQTLAVRGYIGIELLGQNQYWTRLPETAYSQLDPGSILSRPLQPSGRPRKVGELGPTLNFPQARSFPK